jgi:glutamate-1-semialdehyde 2,1-aminomutase
MIYLSDIVEDVARQRAGMERRQEMSEFEKIRQAWMDEYAERRPKSRELFGRARRVMPGGDTRTITWFAPYPSFMARGEGCRMWDADGHQLLDFQSNYTSLIHGHAFPPVVEAQRAQLGMGTVFTAPLESQVRLAEMLVDRTPSVERVRFTNSGTEATMHAVRAARAFTGRDLIVKLEGGYHGSSDIFEASVEPDMEKVGDIENPVSVADSPGVPEQAMSQVLVAPFNRIDITRRIVEAHADRIAAFIMEPIQGSAGQLEPDPEYLRFVRELTRKHGIVLIFDEVVTYRVSRGGAQEYYGVTPDMTTFGKIIGGGLPVGAFGGMAEIMDLYDPARHILSHSGTFNGNALAMVGGATVLEHLPQGEIDRINALGARLRAGLSDAARGVGLNIWVNGVASLVNVVWSSGSVDEYRGIARSREEFNVLLSLGLINRGIFIAPRGMMCTSTPMDEAVIDLCVEAFADTTRVLRPAVEESASELLL